MHGSRLRAILVVLGRLNEPPRVHSHCRLNRLSPLAPGAIFARHGGHFEACTRANLLIPPLIGPAVLGVPVTAKLSELWGNVAD